MSQYKMKEEIINLIRECDMQNADVLSHSEMSPSSSIEEIAEYISERIGSRLMRVTR